MEDGFTKAGQDRDAVGLAVKIGVVLVIATSWASWQALAYDLFAHAPTRIASEVLTSVSARDPIEQLQSALDGLESASLGYRMRAGIASPLIGGPAASAMTLNVSSLILAQSVVGTLVVARVILSILLAIAPVMANVDTTPLGVHVGTPGHVDRKSVV